MENLLSIKLAKIRYNSFVLIASICVALVLAQFCHFVGVVTDSGSLLGTILSPLAFGVLLVGLISGAFFGVLAGVIIPLLSFVFNGMPNGLTLFYMIVEYISYGFLLGILSNKKINIFLKILLTLLIGRIAKIAIVAICYYLFNLHSITVFYILKGIYTSFLAIIFELLFLPLIYKYLKSKN